MRYEDRRKKKSADMIYVVNPTYNEEGFIEKNPSN
jgi:hypothetical protein